MLTFSEQQFKTFKQIAQLKQSGLKKVLVSFLRKHYNQNRVFYSEHYIYAIGDIPIALVAHLDTVHKKVPSQIFWDREEDVIWSPQGLGADDRAGVYAIMQIISSGLRPHIIFTTDEEIGGIGAILLSKRTKPFTDLRYMIELDRRGFVDCVFYDCNNEDFEKYVESFGFETDWGTYSDICELSPNWEIAGVNLSIGYFNEHSFAEYLEPNVLMNTVEKVKEMLKTPKEDIPVFKYIPYKSSKQGYAYDIDEDYKKLALAYGYNFLDDEVGIICSGCHEAFFEDEVFPVKSVDGTTKYYCPDCVTDNIEWCIRCNEPFEKENSGDTNVLCKDCRKIKGAFSK